MFIPWRIGNAPGTLFSLWFGNDWGGEGFECGNCSVLTGAANTWASFCAERFGTLTACLICCSDVNVVAAVVEAPAWLRAFPTLDGAFPGDASPRPNRSTSDRLSPTVLPDKRYKKTVAPDCLTPRSCNVSPGLGIFLPTIHFWTCTGNPYLSKT